MPEVRITYGDYEKNSSLFLQTIPELAHTLPLLVANVLSVTNESVKVDVYKPEYSVNSKTLSIRIFADKDIVNSNLLTERAELFKNAKLIKKEILQLIFVAGLDLDPTEILVKISISNSGYA